MLFQVNTDRSVVGDEALIGDVETTLRERLSRYEDRLTRVEVHLSDVNAERGGSDDKRCMIEVRPNGLAPLAVVEEAATVEQAVSGAASKVISVLEKTFGKLTSRKGH